MQTTFIDTPLPAQFEEVARYVARVRAEEDDKSALVAAARGLSAAKAGDAATAAAKELLASLVEAVPELLAATDKAETEGILTLLFKLVVIETKDTELQAVLVKKISTYFAADGVKAAAALRLRVAGHLFNLLPHASPLRLVPFSAMLEIATKESQLGLIVPQLSKLQSWIKLWEVSVEEERSLLLQVSQALKKAGLSDDSHRFLISYLKTFNGAEKSVLASAEPNAARAVSEAIGNPKTFLFEALLALDAVQHLATANSPLFELLTIFTKENVASFHSFVSSHKSFIQSLGFNEDDLEYKIRLLSLASLASDYLYKDMPCSIVSQSLGVDEDEVEIWIIDAIRANLIEARIDQINRSVYISRSQHREFTEKQWKQLQERLSSWRVSLGEILQVLQNAKAMQQPSQAQIATSGN